MGVPSIKPEENPTPEEAERLSVEHLMLSKAQSEALLKAPYLLMPRAEREAYDRRRVRIEQLRELLSKLSLDDNWGGSHPAATESQDSAA
jgi:hypothetical protein